MSKPKDPVDDYLAWVRAMLGDRERRLSFSVARQQSLCFNLTMKREQCARLYDGLMTLASADHDPELVDDVCATLQSLVDKFVEPNQLPMPRDVLLDV